MDIQTNEREIVPVNIWSPAGIQSLNLIRVDNFQNYFFDGGSGQVHWVMFIAEEIPAQPAVAGTNDTLAKDAEPAQTIKTPILDGLVDIPADVLSGWAQDDEVIFTYVLSALKLTEVTNG